MTTLHDYPRPSLRHQAHAFLRFLLHKLFLLAQLGGTILFLSLAGVVSLLTVALLVAGTVFQSVPYLLGGMLGITIMVYGTYMVVRFLARMED